MTSALPGGQRLYSNNSGATNSRPTGSRPRLQVSRPATAELVSLFPSREVAYLLVDTYFDRVHWFMLIFHQDDFRQTWQQMYDSPREQLADSYPSPGFISTFLVVIAIALQYVGEHRRQLLETLGVSPADLKAKILSTIRAKLLDIVSLGSLEAVQTCVLLGTYYLYHGNPELAWPVCGCGLRIAQALNLHRKFPHARPMSSEMQLQYETRKRCWWAIYEIETFCSMSYGYPHSIKDSDCDVELLDPLARSPVSSDTRDQCPTSLLSYKFLMSKLSVLIKDILTDLYGLGSFKGNPHPDRPGNSSGLHSLIRKVTALDVKLQRWHDEIPDLLQLSNCSPLDLQYTSVEEMDRDIGASGPRFENHIYQLQALALKLAYENTKILLHRPLLAYKTIPTNLDLDSTDPARSPLRLSLQACRDAALRTSELEATSVFPLAADTYAAAFIGIHTFTAGVMLCILTSIEPLAPHSYQSKTGLRRLLSMQVHLKSRSRSTLAAQGLEILERLARLLMDKELKEMLSSGHEALSLSQSRASREEPVTQYQDESIQDQTLTAETLAEGTMFDYTEDPIMSQALYDFDQGVLHLHRFIQAIDLTIVRSTFG